MDAGVQSSRASEEPVGIRVSSLNPASLLPKMYLCLVSGTLIGTGKEMGKGCVLRGQMPGLRECSPISRQTRVAPRKRDWVRSWAIIWRDGPEPKALTEIQQWEASPR